MSLPTVHDELYRKAVDQLAHLQSAYEADRLSAEGFKVGVETIWEILGGVIDTDEFKDLIHAANVEVASLQIEPRIKVLTRAGGQMVIRRAGEQVRITLGAPVKTSDHQFDMEGEAIEYASRIERAATTKGFQREA